MKPVSSGFTLMLKLLDVMTRPEEVRTCGESVGLAVSGHQDRRVMTQLSAGFSVISAASASHY